MFVAVLMFRDTDDSEKSFVCIFIVELISLKVGLCYIRGLEL